MSALIRTTWCNIPEDSILHSHHHEKLKSYKTPYFQQTLKKENWEELYKQENVNMRFDIFYNTFLVIFEYRFPLMYKKKRDINKWITNGIRISCNHK
jgi:uncharacterized FlgJ-related protein